MSSDNGNSWSCFPDLKSPGSERVGFFRDSTEKRQDFDGVSSSGDVPYPWILHAVSTNHASKKIKNLYMH